MSLSDVQMKMTGMPETVLNKKLTVRRPGKRRLVRGCCRLPRHNHHRRRPRRLFAIYQEGLPLQCFEGDRGALSGDGRSRAGDVAKTDEIDIRA